MPEKLHSKSCVVCKKSANLKVCTKCRSSYYCSKEHQIKDWPTHKIECMKTVVEDVSQCACFLNENSVKDQECTVYDKYDCRPLNIMEPDITADLMNHKMHEIISDKIHACLDKKGFCIIDQPYSQEIADGIYDDFLVLQQKAEFQRGELAGGFTSDGKTENTKVEDGIRSDVIAWLSDDILMQHECQFISQLLVNWDTIIIYFQKFHKDKVISGRTKLMAAIYPGNQTGYKRHVDNPSKDGRIYTFIYYLNKNWTPKNGGYLRIFPEAAQSIDYGDVEPIFNRLLIFWSDKRNPHEVHPAFEERRALTAWFFDQVERQKARKANIAFNMDEVSKQMILMNLNQLEVEKNTIKENISCEVLKAVNNLSDTELESFSLTLKPIKGMNERLKALKSMGIGNEIGQALIQVLINNSYL